jgi:hypothetical protein
MANEKFDRGNVLVGGSVCGELQDGSIEIDNGDEVVTGIAGYLGTRDGTVMGTISASRAVPRAGFTNSQDLYDAVLKHKPTTFIVVTGNHQISVTGTIKTLKVAFGKDKTAIEDVSIHGGLTVSAF